MIDVVTYAEEALQRGAAAFSRYRHEMPVLAGAYSRTLLEKTNDYEMVAMVWAPGCKSPIHDHGNSRCWVFVLEGTIDVANFERVDAGGDVAELTAAGTAKLTAGERDCRLTWRELHRVGNTTAENAYTLQIYAPRLTAYHVVDETTGAVREVPGLYDATFIL